MAGCASVPSVTSTYYPSARLPLWRALSIATRFVVAIVITWILTVALAAKYDYSLFQFGIIPRTVTGLTGIVFSPLLHGNAGHLFANAIPLFVLITLLFWNLGYRPGLSLFYIWLGSGFGTWLIGGLGRSMVAGAATVHIGASGLIYGLVAYLIAAGFMMKSWRSAFIAIAIFFLYGGIFWGVLPQDDFISWEAHLSGAIAGVWAARKAHR